MKLARFGAIGRERPALVDDNGRLRDVSSVVPTFDPTTLTAPTLAALRRLDPTDFPLVPARTRLGTPWAGISKYIGIGLNYRDHALETGAQLPTEPVVFLKAISCLSGPNDPIIRPPESTRLDWEVELGIVIGRRASHVSQADALSCVLGYCLLNDVSERGFQKDRGGGQWTKGKGCDSFGPVGPWLVTRDEVPDPAALRLWLTVNGETMQDGSTAEMVFGVAELVSHVSRFMTLMPGDLIATGTPAGVGMGKTPPRYLQPGDEVHLGIDGLGEQRQRVIDWNSGR
ncbi:MAG TPA: 2-hydroxyhepta-2,4-diene-1,7-dioate isomerase [Xanthomonadales bacterium]|nr:2-hydroxyhepta-2,4-diene-1,7-dioate isomerase [Xanthomonadales bacterium]